MTIPVFAPEHMLMLMIQTHGTSSAIVETATRMKDHYLRSRPPKIGLLNRSMRIEAFHKIAADVEAEGRKIGLDDRALAMVLLTVASTVGKVKKAMAAFHFEYHYTGGGVPTREWLEHCGYPVIQAAPIEDVPTNRSAQEDTTSGGSKRYVGVCEMTRARMQLATALGSDRFKKLNGEEIERFLAFELGLLEY